MPEIPKTSLPRKQEGGRLGAGHLNKLSEAAERVFGEAYKPGNSAARPTNPFQMRRVEITARGCDGIRITFPRPLLVILKSASIAVSPVLRYTRLTDGIERVIVKKFGYID